MFSFDNIDSVIDRIKSQISTQKISILCPFYNEKDLIVSNIQIIIEKMRSWGFNFELIVSDDGSHDGSSDLIQQTCSYPELILVRSPRNYGKGRALFNAYQQCSGDFILFLDSDLELPLEHLPFFLEKMLQTNDDVIIGSKSDKDSNLHYPFIRKIFSAGYALILKLLFQLPLKDTQTGIKLFRREPLDMVFSYLIVKRFAFDIELLVLIHKQGYRIGTHPIVLNYVREENLGRMSMDTILHMFKDTLAIFWRLKIGFWNNIAKNTRQKFKHAIISFEQNPKVYSGDLFYCESEDQLESLILSLENYETVSILRKGDEIPIFYAGILDLLFTQSNVDMIVPLQYPVGNSFDEEFYYTTLGNMFYPLGYYPMYRPMHYNVVSVSNYQSSFAVDDVVFRYSYLKELLSGQQKRGTKITANQRTYHAPYCIKHRQFPTNDKEFDAYLDTISCRRFICKKVVNLAVATTVVLFFAAVFSGKWLYVVPFVVIQVLLHMWYIFSLGIRKGIRYMIRFDIFIVKRAFLYILNKK